MATLKIYEIFVIWMPLQEFFYLIPRIPHTFFDTPFQSVIFALENLHLQKRV